MALRVTRKRSGSSLVSASTGTKARGVFVGGGFLRGYMFGFILTVGYWVGGYRLDSTRTYRVAIAMAWIP